MAEIDATLSRMAAEHESGMIGDTPISFKAFWALHLTVHGIEVMRRERDAFLSLARCQKRLSWGYRWNALAAKAAGDREGYLRNAAEARRLWADAKQHLQFARNRDI